MVSDAARRVLTEARGSRSARDWKSRVRFFWRLIMALQFDPIIFHDILHHLFFPSVK
ncbi:hypothetical protein MDA_GLEAN10020452 [Myotis davidii]|uniref:Uncharacterized protein n=1 Tax=Myotis davidii TaxID=225400 RepID=L5LHG0_MYODS|nr:hypothetical protein MDA_GLEAN10020452 [Myotis davidii]